VCITSAEKGDNISSESVSLLDFTAAAADALEVHHENLNKDEHRSAQWL